MRGPSGPDVKWGPSNMLSLGTWTLSFFAFLEINSTRSSRYHRAWNSNLSSFSHPIKKGTGGLLSTMRMHAFLVVLYLLFASLHTCGHNLTLFKILNLNFMIKKILFSREKERWMCYLNLNLLILKYQQNF